MKRKIVLGDNGDELAVTSLEPPLPTTVLHKALE
jgi:hypothetical protein